MSSDNFSNSPVIDSPSSFPRGENYVMKLDANGNYLWHTIPPTLTASVGWYDDFAINGDEIALSTTVNGYDWSGYSLPSVPNNGGYPVIARFNKSDGAMLGVYPLNANFGNGSVTAMLSDNNGNYFMGGTYGRSLTIGSTTMTNSGSDNNFFIAKFGTNNCALGTVDFDLNQNSFKISPNPAHGNMNLFYNENIDFNNVAVYDLSGRLVLKAIVSDKGDQVSINIDNLQSGLYVVVLKQNEVGVARQKLVVE
jgi:hypothetical protein